MSCSSSKSVECLSNNDDGVKCKWRTKTLAFKLIFFLSYVWDFQMLCEYFSIIFFFALYLRMMMMMIELTVHLWLFTYIELNSTTTKRNCITPLGSSCQYDVFKALACWWLNHQVKRQVCTLSSLVVLRWLWVYVSVWWQRSIKKFTIIYVFHTLNTKLVLCVLLKLKVSEYDFVHDPDTLLFPCSGARLRGTKSLKQFSMNWIRNFNSFTC